MVEYLVMCIGNRDGGDDAVGPYIADLLTKEKDQTIIVNDCGIVPENYTSVVARHHPKYIILIDAVDMGLQPGAIRRIPKEKIGCMQVSTHGLPLSLLMTYLEQYTVYISFIGVQIKTVSGQMSNPVKHQAQTLVQLLKKKDIETIPVLEEKTQ